MPKSVDYTTLEDQELVALSKDGCNQAFDELIIRHSRKLHAALYQMTGNYDDAYDIAQEAFTKAYQALPTFNSQSAFYTWLYAIASNHARNFLKKRNRHAVYSLDDDEYGEQQDKNILMSDESHRSNPERASALNELQFKLESALAQLSLKHREVVVLHDIKGMNHTEIAKKLDISEGTLRSRLHYAHRELQSLLAEYLN